MRKTFYSILFAASLGLTACGGTEIDSEDYGGNEGTDPVGIEKAQPAETTETDTSTVTEQPHEGNTR